MEASELISYVVGICGVIGVAVAARAYFKFKGLQTSLNVVQQAIDTITTTAQGLEASLVFERQERANEAKECAVKIGELQGQINVLTSGFVEKLIDAVKEKNVNQDA